MINIQSKRFLKFKHILLPFLSQTLLYKQL